MPPAPGLARHPAARPPAPVLPRLLQHDHAAGRGHRAPELEVTQAQPQRVQLQVGDHSRLLLAVQRFVDTIPLHRDRGVHRGQNVLGLSGLLGPGLTIEPLPQLGRPRVPEAGGVHVDVGGQPHQLHQLEGVQLSEQRVPAHELGAPGLVARHRGQGLDHEARGGHAVLVPQVHVLDVQLQVLHDGPDVAAAVAEPAGGDGPVAPGPVILTILTRSPVTLYTIQSCQLCLQTHLKMRHTQF